MTTNGNGWKNWILTVLLGVLVSLTVFGTVTIQSKADKDEVEKVEQRLVMRDQELKEQFAERIKINTEWMKTLSDKIDDLNKNINAIKK